MKVMEIQDARDAGVYPWSSKFSIYLALFRSIHQKGGEVYPQLVRNYAMMNVGRIASMIASIAASVSTRISQKLIMCSVSESGYDKDKPICPTALNDGVALDQIPTFLGGTADVGDLFDTDTKG